MLENAHCEASHHHTFLPLRLVHTCPRSETEWECRCGPDVPCPGCSVPGLSGIGCTSRSIPEGGCVGRTLALTVVEFEMHTRVQGWNSAEQSAISKLVNERNHSKLRRVTIFGPKWAILRATLLVVACGALRKQEEKTQWQKEGLPM
jgi:hypothetical protein